MHCETSLTYLCRQKLYDKELVTGEIWQLFLSSTFRFTIDMIRVLLRITRRYYDWSVKVKAKREVPYYSFI